MRAAYLMFCLWKRESGSLRRYCNPVNQWPNDLKGGNQYRGTVGVFSEKSSLAGPRPPTQTVILTLSRVVHLGDFVYEPWYYQMESSGSWEYTLLDIIFFFSLNVYEHN